MTSKAWTSGSADSGNETDSCSSQPFTKQLFYHLHPDTVSRPYKPLEIHVRKLCEFTFYDGRFVPGIGQARRLNDALVKGELEKDEVFQAESKVSPHDEATCNMFHILVERSKQNGNASLNNTVCGCSVIVSQGALATIATFRQRWCRNTKLVCGIYRKCLFITREDALIMRDTKNVCFATKRALTRPNDKASNFLLTDAPWIQHCVQTEVKLGKLKMFVNGDLDCLDSTNQQIEIKCQLLGMRNERQHYYITPFWYAEAVLLKTETIVVAERLKDNSVISVKRVHINELETGGENFDASGMVWTPGNKEKKLKWTWTKDKLFGHVEEFVNKIYDLLQSDKYFNKIVVIQKEPQKSTFFIAEVDHNSSRLFPVEFQDHFRQSERLKIRPLALPWEKN